MNLDQWLSTGSDFDLQEHLVISEDILGVKLGGMERERTTTQWVERGQGCY